MKAAMVLLTLLLVFTTDGRASTSLETMPDSEVESVILLTFDGVRWQELFRGTDPSFTQEGRQEIFTYFWKSLAPQGPVFGNIDKGDPMVVGNSVNISLPAYQSIMAGEKQPCLTNGCSQIQVETLPERIIRELKLKREQAATIASWKKIGLAAESVTGTTFVNAGLNPLNDPVQDAELAAINTAQSKDVPPWADARYDKYTFAHALRYLKLHRPRFLFISFDDSDEWGHKNDYRNYVQSLRQYDAWLKELTDTLDALGDYGKRTALIITTDHGRGEGFFFNGHGPNIPDSKYIWLYGRTPSASVLRLIGDETQGSARYTHLDIRPTIESLLGLAPKTCSGCGQVMAELAPHSGKH